MRRKALKARLIAQGFALALAIGVGFSPGAQAKHTKHTKSHESLERLDSAANLLMTIADSDQPGMCGIAPSEARRLLMAIHPMIDEEMKTTITTLSSRPKGKAIADPKWDESCLKNCHCGLYASILEGVGEQRLVPSDRAALEHMNAKASKLSHEQLAVCARESQWFCGSSLLARLKKDAKNYQAP